MTELTPRTCQIADTPHQRAEKEETPMNSQFEPDQDENVEGTELKLPVESDEDTEGHRHRPTRAPLDSDEEDTEAHRMRHGR
jgi:hypothetical protein